MQQLLSTEMLKKTPIIPLMSPLQGRSAVSYFSTLKLLFWSSLFLVNCWVVTSAGEREAGLIVASSGCRGKDGDVSCHCCCVLRASGKENNSRRIYSPRHTQSHGTEDSTRGALQVLEVLLSMSIHSITPRLSVNKVFYPYAYLSHLLGFSC